MKDVYIYGAGVYGRKLLELIKNHFRDDINVVSFIDEVKCGDIAGIDIMRIDSVPSDATIIISLNDILLAYEVYLELKKKRYVNIWKFIDKRYTSGDCFSNFCFECNEWDDGLLPQVEMHVIDSCNLNCRGCSHFSPIFQYQIPDFNDRIKDVMQLKKRVGSVGKFYLLGGEPFLNSQIGDYSIEVSRIFPHAKIYIVTNGLLIPKTSEDVLEKISRSRAEVSISEYIPTKKVIGEVCDRLKAYNISFEIRSLDSKMNFNIPLSLSNQSKKEKMCISDGCVTIWNGMISRCPTLMYIDYFNKHFGVELPSTGRYSLFDDGKNGWELIEEMKRPVELCRHCVKNEIPWSRCDNPPVITDFASWD